YPSRALRRISMSATTQDRPRPPNLCSLYGPSRDRSLVMNASRGLIARCLPAGLVAVVIVGCGGGGGGGTANLNALVQGRAALNRVVTGDKPTNQQTLQSIFDL